MKKINFKLLLFYVLFFFNHLSFSQVAGTLDTSFYGVGYKLIDGDFAQNTNSNFFGKSTIIQSDGKIVLGGIYYNFTANTISFMIIRLNSDASNDLSFGINGYAKVDLPSTINVVGLGASQNAVNTITIQPDGKIILVDSYQTIPDRQYMVAIRFNANGALDNTFGLNGINTIETGFVNNNANAVKVLPDNKILIGGNCGLYQPNASVVRLLSNGVIDTTFGINGITPEINGTLGYSSDIKAMNIQNDGKIVCSGEFNSISNTNFNFFTVRYNSDGSLDNSFGTSGVTITPTSIGYDWANSQVIQPDGKILTVGNGAGVTMVRLNTDGSYDNSFGEYGVVTNNLNVYNAYGRNLVLQPDNKIVVVGFKIDAMIARFNQDGSPDLTFNTVGFTVSDYSPLENLNDEYNFVGLLPDGKLLVTGNATYSFNNLGYSTATISRYHSGLNLSSESFDKKKINLYPNPTKNKVFYDNSQNQYSKVDIYNFLGQKISYQNLLFSNNQEINLENFANGIYVLKFSNNNESVSVKVIKE